MAGPRNSSGVNDASDCVRTVNGVKYGAWMSFPTEDRIKAYRAAGVRCRRFGEELFVHPMDEEVAAQVDRACEA
jgi:hypothetical protein